MVLLIYFYIRGIYYKGLSFNTTIGARVDATVNFNWNDGNTGIPTLGTSVYSVRWSGTLRAKFTGKEKKGGGGGAATKKENNERNLA